MPDFNWNDLKYVLAVSRVKSFAMAAQKLGVNERTVARRIREAETRLNAQLFEKNRGVYKASKTGQKVIAYAERIETETLALANEVTGANQLVAGNVRLTAVPVILNRILIPAASRLSSRYPELELEMVAEPRDLSLARREADIALRMARPTQDSSALARRIGGLDYAVYGKAGVRDVLLPWINYSEERRDLPQARWITEHLTDTGESLSPVSVNDSEAVLAALRAGLGKSLLPVTIGDTASDLIRLRPSICLSREIWVMLHPDLRHLARIRVVLEWLDDIFRRISPESE